MDTVPSIDLYRELEVDPNATPETIDAAWRSLVKRHHPDIAADRAAAIEKIKRLNLAHDWLGDRRLREMYDLTRLRRGHPDLGFGDPPRRPSPAPDRTPSESPARRPNTSQRSTVASAAIVAVLLVGALVTVALGPPGGGTRPGGGGVAAATARASQGSLIAGGGSTGRTVPVAEPEYTRDLPSACDVPGQGQAFRFPFTVDGLPALVYYAPCGTDRTWGPLTYVQAAGGWERRTTGKLETAFPKDKIPRSISGEKNEFGLVWSVGDGVDTWLVIYRVAGTQLESVWSSLGAGIDRWGLAQFQFAPDVTGAGGSITVRFADMETGSCRTCSDHKVYEETYQWNPDLQALELSYRGPVGGAQP